MATLTAGLDGLLRTLCAKPGRWILIVERNDRRMFWQGPAYLRNRPMAVGLGVLPG